MGITLCSYAHKDTGGSIDALFMVRADSFCNLHSLVLGQAPRADVLFPKRPTLHFYPELSECPVCGSTLNVQKTDTKTVVTMDIGAFFTKETYDHK